MGGRGLPRPVDGEDLLDHGPRPGVASPRDPQLAARQRAVTAVGRSGSAGPDYVDTAWGVVRDLVWHVAEYESACALHAPVADHDEIRVLLLGHLDQGVRGIAGDGVSLDVGSACDLTGASEHLLSDHLRSDVPLAAHG